MVKLIHKISTIPRLHIPLTLFQRWHSNDDVTHKCRELLDGEQDGIRSTLFREEDEGISRHEAAVSISGKHVTKKNMFLQN